MPAKSPITQQKPDKRTISQSRFLRREMTPPERLLWAHLRNDHLGGFHFRRQQIIGPYFADFYCHQIRLIVEIDGDIHALNQEHDLQRDHFLKENGYIIARFAAREVTVNLALVLDEILHLCRAEKK
jgi:very-short-patch-repair endonuclease